MIDPTQFHGSIDADPATCIALARRPDLIHYIGHMQRIGVWSFITFLEHRHYPPGTPANPSFRLALMDWQEMKWAIVSIPKRLKGDAEKLMATLGLHAVRCTPSVIDFDGVTVQCAAREFIVEEFAGGRKISRFPHFDTDSCFTLEYTNKGQHFAYQNDKRSYELAYEAEKAAVEKEVREYREQQKSNTIRL